MDATTFADKRITIMGLGFFGGSIGLARYLVSQGAQVTITDLKPAAELQDSMAALHGLPVRFVLGGHETGDFTDVDMVFASPAVRQDSSYLIAARAHGVPIDTEMNLFMRLCRGSVIGVTGSNGKTTTTSLIGAILRSGEPPYAGGGEYRSLPPPRGGEPSSRVILWCWSYPVFSSRISPRLDGAHISASSSTSLPITSIVTALWRPIWRRRCKFLPIKDLMMSPSSTPMIRDCTHSSAGCAVRCACSVACMQSRTGPISKAIVSSSPTQGWRWRYVAWGTSRFSDGIMWRMSWLQWRQPMPGGFQQQRCGQRSAPSPAWNIALNACVRSMA